MSFSPVESKHKCFARMNSVSAMFDVFGQHVATYLVHGFNAARRRSLHSVQVVLCVAEGKNTEEEIKQQGAASAQIAKPLLPWRVCVQVKLQFARVHVFYHWCVVEFQ